jgi:ABC-type amino acid transport substrate-binding protein
MTIGSSKAVGLSVELAQAIMDDVRKKIQKPDLQIAYMPVTSQNRFPLLVNGTYDLECGSTTNNATRAKDVCCSTNFFYIGTRLLTKKTYAKNPALLEVVGDSLQVEPCACMVRKDDPAFKKLVDDNINRLMKSGEFAKLYTNWFESPIVPKGVNLALPMSAELKANLPAISDKPAL